jgi:hypothetical protein
MLTQVMPRVALMLAGRFDAGPITTVTAPRADGTVSSARQR